MDLTATRRNMQELPVEEFKRARDPELVLAPPVEQPANHLLTGLDVISPVFERPSLSREIAFDRWTREARESKEKPWTTVSSKTKKKNKCVKKNGGV